MDLEEPSQKMRRSNIASTKKKALFPHLTLSHSSLF